MFIQIIGQIFLGIVFLILSVILFTTNGFAILRVLKLPHFQFLERYVLSTTIGFSLFTLIAYLFAYLNIRFLMWAFPISGLLILLKFRKAIFSFDFDIPKKFVWIFLTVLVIGMVGQVAVNAPSGWSHPDGIYFYSSHGHDGVWHLALMEEMHKNVFPFQNPEYAGSNLQNYHFFVDLLMSEITRMFPFSNMDIYFRFIPVLFSLLLGLSSFIFVKLWTGKIAAGLWAMFFTYFTGSFGYLLAIPRQHSLGGETTFWVSQTQSVLGNPPHAAAFIILMVSLFLIYKYLQNTEKKYFVLITLLGGVAIEFKVYGGLLILGGLLVIGLWRLVTKKEIKTLLLFVSTGGLAALIYLPNSVGSQGFLVWQPFWFIRTMVVAPDRLDMLEWELRRQTYLSENNIKRVIQMEAMAFSVFLFGNLGMRFLGFWTIAKKFKENIFKHEFEIFLFSITFASFIIPVLFVQKGVAWNAIQFSQYFLLLFGLIAAPTAYEISTIFKKPAGKIVVITVVVLLAVPTQIGLLWQFYSNRPLSKITNEEITALKFLRSTGSQNDIVLTPGFDIYARLNFTVPPIPIYSWYDTGYIPAISGKRTLLSDAEQVKIMGYPVDDLIEERKKIFRLSDSLKNPDLDPKIINKFLKDKNISYLYLLKDQQITAPIEKLNLDLIYQTDNVRIFKVKSN